MEILCAYIRENAPASKAVDLNMEDWPYYSREVDRGNLQARKAKRWARSEDLTQKIARSSEHKPRTDIQTALTVLGRRDAAQILVEHAATGPGERMAIASTSAAPACKPPTSPISISTGQTSTGFGWKGRPYTMREWSGRTSAERGWTGRVCLGADVGGQFSQTQMEGAVSPAQA